MVLLKVAEYLRNDILEHNASCDTSNWPPTIENLSEFDENFLKSLSLFLTKILKAKDNPLSGSMQRYVHFFGSDLVNTMANGKIVTLKHFLSGLGLHNITGLRMPIKVLSHLGHCIDYNLVCETETAEAEIALQWLAEHKISQLQQDHEDSDVQHIVFWWFDNFNQKLDSASGYGTIDATHIVEFKENVDVSNAHQLQSDPSKTSINHTKRRSLQNIGAVLPSLSINKNKEPSIVSQEMGEAQKLTVQEEKKKFYYIHQLLHSSVLVLLMISSIKRSNASNLS